VCCDGSGEGGCGGGEGRGGRRLVGREDQLLQLLVDPWRAAQVDAVVGDADQLVHHRLVRPLAQQRRHRVVPPVDNQQQRRHIRPPERKQVRVRVHCAEDGLGDPLGDLGAALVADLRPLLEREQQRAHALVQPVEDGLLPDATREAGDRADIEMEEVGGDGEVVGEVLVHLLHHLVLVRLRQLLDHPVARRV